MAIKQYVFAYRKAVGFLRSHAAVIWIVVVALLLGLAYHTGRQEGLAYNYDRYEFVRAGCAGGVVELVPIENLRVIKSRCVYNTGR